MYVCMVSARRLNAQGSDLDDSRIDEAANLGMKLVFLLLQSNREHQP